MQGTFINNLSCISKTYAFKSLTHAFVLMVDNETGTAGFEHIFYCIESIDFTR
jgi:hypothetical protein